MKLSDKAKTAIALYQRSPHDAEGWAACSSAVMRIVIPDIPSELVEVDGLRVRLNERGNIVAEYL